MTVISDPAQHMDVVAWRLYIRDNSKQGWNEKRTQNTKNFLNDNEPVIGVMYLLNISRAIMPSMGTAAFCAYLGDINGLTLTPGNALDLLHKEIRIDVAYDDVDEGRPESGWQVAFWGICEQQDDVIAPAAEAETRDDIERGFVAAGRRLYRCLDLTSVLRRRYLYRHAYQETVAASPTVRANARGVPGFNTSQTYTYAAPLSYANRGTTTQTAPNGVTYFPHVLASPSAATWTDKQVAEALIGAHVAEKDPAFTITDDSSLLNGVQPWLFPEGMPVRDALAMIFDRRRGKGAAYLDWSNGTDVGIGPDAITPIIRVVPQTYDDVNLGGALGTQDGASTAGTSVDVTLTGDHRVLDDGYDLGGSDAFTVDYVETVGERIQVLVSLSYVDETLEKRWSDANETTVDGGDENTAEQATLAHVYRLHGLPLDWDGSAGNGNGSGGNPGSQNYACNYAVADDGTLIVPKAAGAGDNLPEFSPLSVRFLPDCPIHAGIDPTDGTTATDADARKDTPGRLGMEVFRRTGDDTYEHVRSDVQVQATDHTLSISGDRGAARIGSDKSSILKKSEIIVRCGLELPNRVRLATGDPDGERRIQARVPDAHLWIGHESSMIGIADDGSGERIGASQVIYRDDRDLVRRRHALAEAWYLRERRALQYSIRDCGFTQYDQARDTTEWPRIGQVIGTLSASSEDYTINTPISSIVYDHESGVTTWATDWLELDL